MNRISQLLAKAQQPIERYLWIPADAVKFTPRVLDAPFGDGRALFAITTIYNRPKFWIVRGDSSWTTESDYDSHDTATDFKEICEDVLEALETEFGRFYRYETEQNADGDWIDEETGEPLAKSDWEYPVVDTADGYSWARLSWPEIDGLRFEPHPFSKRHNLLCTG